MNGFQLTLMAVIALSYQYSATAFTPIQNSNVASARQPTERYNFFSGFSIAEPAKTNDKDAKSKRLIEKTKDLVYNKSGFYSPYDASFFSEEFVFRGPNIGPLNKADYLLTMDAFKTYNVFPDISPNAWGYSIDPENPNRVWFMVRNSGTFTGDALLPNLINYKANGKEIKGSPETFSVIYDEDEKLKYLSVGYVADRFEGNTDGKGAVVGLLKAVGIPYPSKFGLLLRFGNWYGSEIDSSNGKTYSKKEDLPSWWTDERVCSDGYL